eukprot:NODE_5449_length_311_cov_425.843511_g4837_i0.p1 GENE.NODE_5449_length_311_cov_425.843511_g4837_i0~~NODE_5449_length_311_cov_425.843511_g4837_i0.p1  ORF type:complete len:61 (-),score=26.07 NODE_5449_length_311_cov_425.843511_g4837_i0:127-285(-)
MGMLGKIVDKICTTEHSSSIGKAKTESKIVDFVKKYVKATIESSKKKAKINP